MSVESPTQAARRIAPLAASLSEQIERERALPGELVEQMLDGGMFHLCLPRSCGGPEVSAEELFGALSELARGDGASAWCAMVASTSSLLGGYLQSEEAQAVFDGGRSIAGGVFAPRGSATRAGQGFAVAGQWSFVSGIGHSDWVFGGCIVQGAGGPELLDGGRPDVRLLAMRRGEVEVIDTWSVAGLCGTGSHDMAADGVAVPAGRGVSLFSDRPRESGPLYSFPLFGLLALGIGAVSLGIARASIDDLVALANGKRPAQGARTLAERPAVQIEIARAEARLRAARALAIEQIGEAWSAAEAGAPLSDGTRAGLRLAATHATETSADVTAAMYRAGGGSAIYSSSPLQRRFRDANVATQHMMVAPATWELTGRMLLGQPTDTAQL